MATEAVFDSISHASGGSLSPFHSTRLDNGVLVLVKEMPRSPAAFVSIWCKTGTAHEDPQVLGVSHFLEHMFFKGTERFGPGEIDRVIKGIGGDNNASTSLEYTNYYATVPAEHYRSALEVLTDALLHSLFDPEEIDRERQVVLEEIALKEDDPESKAFLELQLAIGVDTPYGRPVLGTPESLAHIDRDVFRRYLAERYTGPNLCLVVSGDVERHAVRAAAEELLAAVPAGDPAPMPTFPWQVLRGQEKRLQRDVNHTYLTLGFRAAGLDNLAAAYDLELLAAILGEGRSSRLVRRLREELGIVTSISAWTWDLTGGGFFAITASMQPGDEAQVREEIEAILNDVRQQPVAPWELERAVTMSMADFRLSTETAADVGETLGYAHVTTGAEETLRYIDRLHEVTRERLQAVARQWLDPATGVAVTVCPANGNSDKAVTGATTAGTEHV